MNNDFAKAAKVSVIIPAYRAAATIGRAVRSVLTQTRPAAEILVVDDGSPDDITSALAEFGERVTLLRKPNGGAASARNVGIERASGDFIAFLDADDYWAPTKLERQLEVFKRFPEVGLVAGRFYLQEPEGERHPRQFSKDPAWDRVLSARGDAAFQLATTTWTGTVTVRRDVLGNERFVPGLEPAEDRDLWVRLIHRSAAYFFSEMLATQVLTPGSLSRSNVRRDCNNMLRVIHRNRILLTSHGLRLREADVYRAWASEYLGAGEPKAAILPAYRRLIREPHRLQAWWIVIKSIYLAMSPSSDASMDVIVANSSSLIDRNPVLLDEKAKALSLGDEALV